MKRIFQNQFSARPLIYIAILIFIFWNYFQPSVVYKFNIVSPSLNKANVDFHAYFSGGKSFAEGIDPFKGTRFVYPPTFLPLYSLLSKLDYNNARVVWVWVYSIFFALTLGLTFFWIEPRKRIDLLFLVGLIVFISFPFAYHVQQGQMDLIVASFSFASLVLYLLGQKNLSALSLAIATLIKVTPALFLITYILFFRDWRYLIRYLAALLLIILVSGIFFPLDYYRRYIMEVLPGSTGGVRHPYNQTLLRYFAGQKIIPQLLTAIGLFWISAMAWFSGKRFSAMPADQLPKERNPERNFMGAAFFLANGLTILLFAGKAWIMAYVWFILPLAVVLLYALESGRLWWIAMILFGAIAIHAQVGNGRIFSAINMIGAAVCLSGIIFMLLWPRLALSENKRIHPDSS